jgi:predicted nuclease of restriction endonuclease-like RecB superfamily
MMKPHSSLPAPHSCILREALLRVAVREPYGIPIWLRERDEPWIRATIGEMDGCTGRTAGDFDRLLDHRLIPMCLSWGASPQVVRGVAHILRSMWSPVVSAPAKPSEIRHVLFGIAATGARREEAIARTAEVLQIRPEEVLEGAYADRAGARRLVAPDELPSASRIVELYNLALARGLMMRSAQVQATVKANVRSVVRYANLKRLICTCAEQGDGTQLQLSGPLSLFRQTTRYGHALASFLPALMVTPGWSLQAQCIVRKQPMTVRMEACDPIASVFALPREADSTVERKLMRDVRRLGTAWILQRETAAIRAGARVFFPDFSLRRGDNRVLVEIVGFYTREYLESKMAALREAGLHGFIVCVDESLACTDEEFSADRVLRYKKSVDAAQLLKMVEEVAVSLPASGGL